MGRTAAASIAGILAGRDSYEITGGEVIYCGRTCSSRKSAPVKGLPRFSVSSRIPGEQHLLSEAAYNETESIVACLN
jgi:hypothetical protein